MSLLSPFFLLGLLGIALPIWLHRLQTNTTDRKKFSSVMFLEQSQQRVHVQRKLKYLLLMALRILFLILLVLAFTKPVFFFPPEAAVTEDTTHHVIVVDNSFSMREGDSFSQASSLAEGIIDYMPAEDIASLYTASDSVQTLSTATNDLELLRKLINSIEPDMGRLDIGATISSLDNLIENSQANFILHFISDFQKNSQAVRFADMIPSLINGRAVTLSTHQIKTSSTPNWSVDSVEVSEASTVRVGLKYNSYVETGSETTEEKTLTLLINEVEQQSITESVSIAPDGVMYITFENVLFDEGDNRIDIELLPKDSLSEDDSRHAVFDNSPPAPVILLTSNPESIANTYLSVALATAPQSYEVQVQTINSFDARVLQRYPWIIVDDIGAINASLQQELLSYVEGGGSILASVGERTIGLDTIPVGGLAINNSLTLNRNSSYTVQGINSSHPALDRTSGWSNLSITQLLPIVANEATNENSNVLITTSGGFPFLIEQNLGLGRFLLLNTKLNNTWSDLPVKPIFVSFMAEAAQHLSNQEELIKEQVVNSFIQLGQNGGTSGQVYAPNGESMLSLSDTTRAQNIQLTQTGYYTINTLGGEVLVAVNPDPRESDLRIMENQALENWKSIVSSSAGNSTISSPATELTEELELNSLVEEPVTKEAWHILLILLAVIVLLESILGNRYLRFSAGNT